MTEMENNHQSGPVLGFTESSVQGLSASLSFPLCHGVGILPVIIAVIGRISVYTETG